MDWPASRRAGSGGRADNSSPEIGILEIRLLISFCGPAGSWRPPRACQPGLAPSCLALGTPLRQWPPVVPDVSDDVSEPPPRWHACPPFYCYRDVRYSSRHFVFVPSRFSSGACPLLVPAAITFLIADADYRRLDAFQRRRRNRLHSVGDV